MRIWIVNYYAAPPLWAGNTRHHSLARRLVQRGHSVLIAGTLDHHLTFRKYLPPDRRRPRREVIEGVRYHWYPLPFRGDRRWARMLNWLAFAGRAWARPPGRDESRPDLVIGSSPTPVAAWIGLRWAKRFSVPFVYEIRDLWPLTLEELGGYSPQHPAIGFLKRLNAHLVRQAELIVALLEGTSTYLEELGLQCKRLVHIPNAAELSTSSTAGHNSARQPPLKVMYAGNHGFANALDSLLDCAAELRERGLEKEFEMVFVGDGPEKLRLIARSKQLRLPNVCFEDPVPKKEVYSKLAEADVLIATLRDSNLYRFGISLNKVYDYLSVGRPIVFGGNPEGNPVALAGAGILVPPEQPKAMADALMAVAEMAPEERVEMGRRGRAYAEAHCGYRSRAEVLERALQQTLEEHH